MGPLLRNFTVMWVTDNTEFRWNQKRWGNSEKQWRFHLLDFLDLRAVSIDPQIYLTTNVGNLSHISVDKFHINFLTQNSHISNNEMSLNDVPLYWISHLISLLYCLISIGHWSWKNRSSPGINVIFIIWLILEGIFSNRQIRERFCLNW